MLRNGRGTARVDASHFTKGCGSFGLPLYLPLGAAMVVAGHSIPFQLIYKPQGGCNREVA